MTFSINVNLNTSKPMSTSSLNSSSKTPKKHMGSSEIVHKKKTPSKTPSKTPKKSPGNRLHM